MIYISHADATPQGIFIADSRNVEEPRVLVAQDWALLHDTENGHIGLRLIDRKHSHQDVHSKYESACDVFMCTTCN